MLILLTNSYLILRIYKLVLIIGVSNVDAGYHMLMDNLLIGKRLYQQILIQDS